MHPLRSFKCGGPHKARDCREPGSVPAGYVPRERKNRSVQLLGMRGVSISRGTAEMGKPKKRPSPPLGEASSERKQRTSAMPEKNFSIKLAGSPNSCVIQLGKQRYRALVDTGAEVSLVHRRVFDKLKHGYVLGKQKVNLQAVNGNKLQVDGCATVKFKLGGRKFHHTFYVVDGLNRNVILGKDWIINNKVVLYFNEVRSMKIGQVYVPLEEDIHISALVRAASTQWSLNLTWLWSARRKPLVFEMGWGWGGGGGGGSSFSRFLPQIGVILAWNPGCSCRNRLSR